MGQNEILTDPESFAREIDGTIDDLFRPEKTIEIDPLTNEVRDVVGPKETAKAPVDVGPDAGLELKLELDLDSEQAQPAVEAISRGKDDLVERLNQALMTLEWEVTRDNTRAARACFSELIQGLNVNSDHRLMEIVGLMDGVFDVMEESPQEMPTSAPKALQEGLKAIVTFTTKPRPADAAGELLESAKRILKDAARPLPGIGPPETVQETRVERFEEDLEALDLEIESDESAPIPPETSVSKEPPIPPPLETASEGQDLADASPPAGAVRDDDRPRIYPAGRGDESDLQEGELVALLRSHVEVLDACINRLLPVETLLARTPGTDKLHIFHKRLREDLERERERLSGCLRGAHAPFHAYPTRQEPQRKGTDRPGEALPERQSALPACPWKELLAAQWQGRTVAFVPEQVAFEGSLPWWSRNRLKKGNALALGAFRIWPWNRLKPRFKGRLSEMDEAALGRLQLPIVHRPEEQSNQPQAVEGRVVLVLFDTEKGGIALLDTPTTVLPVPETCRWNPSTNGARHGWAGSIECSGEIIPVATLENLL